MAYRVKCRTCGGWLADKYFRDGLGELARPHHVSGEECAKEDPDWTTATGCPETENPAGGHPSHRKGYSWLWILGMAMSVGSAAIGLLCTVFARIQEPDLSETRLFIRCWWAYGLILFGCFSAWALLLDSPKGRQRMTDLRP